MAEPNPTSVAPWYLRDLCQALELDPVSGNVFIRTGLSNSIVNITGPVSIPGLVTVTGNVGVTSLPPITGNVNANITGGNSNVVVTGNIAGITALPPITGNVNANITGGNSNVVVTSMPSITGNVNANITGGNSNVVVTGNIAGITALPPITGNVNANITGGNSNVTVSGNVAVTQATSPWIVSTAANTVLNTSIVGMNIDAFGRLRVSNPYTLFDSALSGERRYDFSTQTSGTGSVVYNYNANVRELQINAGSATDSVVRESMLVFPYQPGKSLLIMHSVCFADWTFGATQRAGLFDTDNGIYFQQNGKTSSFVIRSSSSGATTEEVITQANWNNDPMNGTGPSGFTLDIAAPQLIWQSIAWLGVGTCQVGFVIDGKFILCHSFNHANNPTYPTTYMGTAVLPLRYEITSQAAGIGTATLQQICSTVISEGGYDQAAATASVGTDVTPLRLASAGTYYPIASIRLNSGNLNSIAKVTGVSILSPTVNYYRWAVVKNATLTGATWTSPSSTARVDADTDATSATGGIEVQSGYASSRENVVIDAANFYARLGRTLTGVSDTFTLIIAATNNNADVLAEMQFQEIM